MRSYSLPLDADTYYHEFKKSISNNSDLKLWMTEIDGKYKVVFNQTLNEIMILNKNDKKDIIGTPLKEFKKKYAKYYYINIILPKEISLDNKQNKRISYKLYKINVLKYWLKEEVQNILMERNI